jgi:hypothetical protein
MVSFPEPHDFDDPAFYEVVTRIAEGVVREYDCETLHIVRIDHWFGPKWMRFEGKVLGAAGAHSFPGRLIVPPFHPHRVVRELALARQSDGSYCADIQKKALHGQRTSGENQFVRIPRPDGAGRRAYLWFSGDSKATGIGCVMAYVVSREPREDVVWYLEHERSRGWARHRIFGISERELQRIYQGDRVAVSIPVDQ